MTNQTTVCGIDGSPAKPVHMADKVNSDGGVSAVCYAVPRAINLARATWTLRPEAVTCPKCKTQMRRTANG